MPNVIPDLQAGVLCDDVRQERNGKFMLIGLFDALQLPVFPARYPRFFAVTRWCSGEGRFEQRTRILKPDQTTAALEGKPLAVLLPHPEATATNVEVFLQAPFEQEGTYWVEILLDDALKLRYPLKVGQARKAKPD